MTRLLTEALAGFAPVGPAEGRVADFLGANRHRLTAMSLDEIAAAVAVSQPTVTRTMVRLGYRNALELRMAAALVDHVEDRRRGRLTFDEIERAAALIASAYDLYIYPAPELLSHTQALFRHVFPKTQVDLPMKPQLRTPGPVPVRVEPLLERRDAVLVLALAAPPPGHNLASMTANARAVDVPILMLQASDFVYEESTLNLSLGLPGGTPPVLAALLVTAAVAEIRMAADRLNVTREAPGNARVWPTG